MTVHGDRGAHVTVPPATDATERPAPTSLLARLRRDLGYYVPAQILSTILNIASVAAFTRLLDPKGYGMYTLVFSGALFVNDFVFAWFQASALRYWFARTKEGEATKDQFLSTVLAMYLGLGLASALVWPLLLGLLFEGADKHIAWLGFPLLLGQAGTRVVLSRCRALRELRAYFWYSLLPQGLGLAFGLLLVWRAGVGPAGLLIAMSAGPFTILAIELARRFRSYVPRRFCPSRAEAARLLDYGVPILITSIGSTLLFFGDRFLIARFFGVAVAGVYVVGYTLVFKIDQISLLPLSAAFPLMVQDYETQPREVVGASMTRLLSAVCAIFFPACVGMALVARPLTAVVLGPEFHEASRYIAPLSLGVFAVGLHHYVSKPFQLAAQNRPQVVIQLFGAVPQLVINLLLLRKLGPIVAAYATTFSLVVVTAITYLWGRRYLPYRFDWRVFARIAGASAVMVVAALAASAPLARPTPVLVVRIVVGVLVYALLAVWLDLPGARRLQGRLLRRRRRAP